MTIRARLIGLSFELDKIASALATAREEVAFRILREKDWLELGTVLYGRASKYSRGSPHNESGLFAFERAAIESYFPAPPASVLVGACGGGREIFGLLERGYRIEAAYDPVPTFVEVLRDDPRLFDANERLFVGSHQDIDAMTPIAELRRSGRTVDAIVVGWGSYTHLLGTERRVAFLRSLRSLCPHGPVLLSFFLLMGSEAERPRKFRSRLRRVLGTTDDMVESGDGLHRGAGGIHYFTQASFTSEAERAGYRVEHWQDHDFAAAHAVLIPQTSDRGQ